MNPKIIDLASESRHPVASPLTLHALMWMGFIAGMAMFLVISPVRAADALVVFAAVSTTEVVESLVEKFERQRAQPIVTSFAASSVLARQIAHGAPGDVFISAHPRWMDDLARRDLVVDGNRCDGIGNRLVLVARVDSVLARQSSKDLQIRDIESIERLAMADPDHVPAGIYGRQALTWLGAWPKLKTRVIPAANVRGALAFVDRGEVGAGIVYGTDVKLSDRIAVIFTFPPESHDPIVYAVAQLRGGHRGPVEEFVRYLFSPKARRAWTDFGFTIIDSAGCSP